MLIAWMGAIQELPLRFRVHLVNLFRFIKPLL